MAKRKKDDDSPGMTAAKGLATLAVGIALAWLRPATSKQRS